MTLLSTVTDSTSPPQRPRKNKSTASSPKPISEPPPDISEGTPCQRDCIGYLQGQASLARTCALNPLPQPADDCTRSDILPPEPNDGASQRLQLNAVQPESTQHTLTYSRDDSLHRNANGNMAQG